MSNSASSSSSSSSSSKLACPAMLLQAFLAQLHKSVQGTLFSRQVHLLASLQPLFLQLLVQWASSMTLSGAGGRVIQSTTRLLSSIFQPWYWGGGTSGVDCKLRLKIPVKIDKYESFLEIVSYKYAYILHMQSSIHNNMHN